MDTLSYSDLRSAVNTDSVIRLTVPLEPLMPDGIVFPPTYSGIGHLFRPAWYGGEKIDCVVLDSVQSQANRIELSLLEAHRRGDIAYPDIRVEVNATTGREEYSVLELSHRIYDAALRMCLVGDTLFPDTEVGVAVYGARLNAADALFTHAPITLVLGGWDSHGGGGPLVSKLPRLITSEIIGLNAVPARHSATKTDPMDIRKAAGPVYESNDPKRLIEVDEGSAKRDKKGPVKYKKDGNPSNAGLGNVVMKKENTELGAVISGAVQTAILSLTAARRVRFSGEDQRDERNLAGQTALVALGLYGVLSQMDYGYDLRARCALMATDEARMEIIGRTAKDTQQIQLDTSAARQLLKEALTQAREYGLAWRDEHIVAKADERLTQLIESSRHATDEDGAA